MARARRFTADELDLIRKRRAQDWTLEQIADLFGGVPISTLSSVLRRGYRASPVPTLPRSRNGRPRRFDEATVKLIADRRAEGYSVAEIAAELNAPVTTVRRATTDYQRDPRHSPKTCPTCHQTLP